MAAIMGLNKWRSPLQVYLEKIGEAIPIEENQAMRWGNLLEPVIINEFNRLREEMNLQPFVQMDNAIEVSTEDPRFLCSPDGRCYETNEGCECKVSSIFGEELRDIEPEEVRCIAPSYWYQCQWYLMVTGASVWHLLILSHGRELFHFQIKPDEDDFAMMRERAIQFLQMVDSRTPPLASDIDAKFLPDPVDEAAEIHAGLVPYFEEFEEMKRRESDAKKAKEAAKNQIIQGLNGASSASGFGWKFKYFTVERGEYTVKASSYNKTTITRSK